MVPQSNFIVSRGASFGGGVPFTELQRPEDNQKLLDLLQSNECTHIGTAHIYESGNSESTIA